MRNLVRKLHDTYDFVGTPETVEFPEFHPQRLRDEVGVFQIRIVNKAFIINDSRLLLMGRQSLDMPFSTVLFVDIRGSVLTNNNMVYVDVPLMAHMKLRLQDVERTVTGNQCSIRTFLME